jgi:hypothetical protein
MIEVESPVNNDVNKIATILNPIALQNNIRYKQRGQIDSTTWF